jgi:hypothetical protein
MRTLLLASLSVVAVAATTPLFAAGCGGSSPSGFGNDDGGDGGNPNDDSGNPFDLDATGGDGGGKKLGCSGDLRSVIDENGVVQQTCPPDQGCAGGTCVPACQAAAASKGSIGCDYVVPTPSFYAYIKPPCFAVFVANNWPKDIKLTVTRDGQSFDATKFGRIAAAGAANTWAPVPATGVPAGKVAVLFLSDDPASVNGGNPLTCPVAPALRQNEGTAIAGSGSGPNVTGRGKAWHIVADAPITAYDILPFGGASSYLPSAELLFPTTAWGTNYFGIVPQRGTSAPQWGQVVAAEDGTSVTVLPSVNLPAGTNVNAATKNVQATYTLNAGEYIQWQETNEMSGTVFQSTKPISFFGGQGYDCYSSATSSGGGCDSAHQQVPQVSAFGSEYAVAPYTTRRKDLAPESIRYRFVGAVAGTTLTYSPAVPSAPTTIGVGQVVDFETALPFVVKAQDNNHPFFIGQVMTGCSVTSGSRGNSLGDEEYVNVLAPAQFLTKYVFFSDPTYKTTNLVVTRRKVGGSFADVNLDCAGTLKNWKPLGATGDYEYTDVDLIREGVKNGSCDNGPHTADSAKPFGITVWGLDYYSSYAYPAGGNVAPINTVIVPPTPN